jgi:hypothetical protein
VEAEMEHEYLPFSVAKLTFGSCAAVPDGVDAVCGLLLEQAEGRASNPSPKPEA